MSAYFDIDALEAVPHAEDPLLEERASVVDSFGDEESQIEFQPSSCWVEIRDGVEVEAGTRQEVPPPSQPDIASHPLDDSPVGLGPGHRSPPPRRPRPKRPISPLKSGNETFSILCHVFGLVKKQYQRIPCLSSRSALPDVATREARTFVRSVTDLLPAQEVVSPFRPLEHDEHESLPTLLTLPVAASVGAAASAVVIAKVSAPTVIGGLGTVASSLPAIPVLPAVPTAVTVAATTVATNPVVLFGASATIVVVSTRNVMSHPTVVQFVVTRLTTPIRYSPLRSNFRERALPQAFVSRTNEHGKVASYRSVADDFITAFAAANGLRVHSISKSAKDEMLGVPGSRFFHTEKDLRLIASSQRIQANSLVKLIDVDYYLSEVVIESLLAQARCIAMYTVVPEHLYYETTESSFSINSEGILTENMKGSLPYCHPLWDWNRDYITLTNKRFVHAYVDSIRIAPNRRIVLISPARVGSSWASWFWLKTNKVRPLERWKPQHSGGVNIIRSVDTVTLAKEGLPREITVTNSQFSELMSMDPNKMSNAAVMRILETSEPQYLTVACFKSILRENFTFAEHGKMVATVSNSTPPPPTVTTHAADHRPNSHELQASDRNPRSYKAEYSDVYDDDSVRVRGQKVFPPLIDGSFVPASCTSDDLRCIDARVSKLHRENFTPKRRYYSYLNDFLDQMASMAPKKIHPLGLEEVIARAHPSQRRKYENALVELKAYRHKAFQKTESYPEVKDPRNISAVDPKHVLYLLRFIHPFVDLLKQHCKWYCFGLKPTELAERVAEIMGYDDVEALIEGDFSRFDGTQTSICVDVVVGSLVSVFDAKWHDEIRSLNYALSYALFVTENHVRYNTRDTHKSGSGDTSCRNTVVHAFAQYCHFRDRGFSHTLAWIMIGLCAGDDGLVRTADPKGYEQTCLNLGFKLKAIRREPGDPVGFLGRIWPVWGDRRSFFDPRRCLTKYHFSTCSDRRLSRECLAFRKAAGYYVTDAGNFIGHISRTLLEVTRTGKTEVMERRPWLRDILKDNTVYTSQELFTEFQDAVFPTWISNPDTLYCRDAPSDDVVSNDPCFMYFCEQVEMNPTDVFNWYAELTCIDELSEIQTLLKVEVENPTFAATVDDTIVGPRMAAAPQPARVQPEREVICRFFFDKRKRCNRGTECKFSHDISGVCRNNLLGKCTRGVNCKFQHMTLSAAI